MSLAGVHARLFSLNHLNVVPSLLDGEWLELRRCPINTINRAANEHVHRSRWSRFMRATIELIGAPSFVSARSPMRLFHLDWSSGYVSTRKFLTHSKFESTG